MPPRKYHRTYLLEAQFENNWKIALESEIWERFSKKNYNTNTHYLQIILKKLAHLIKNQTTKFLFNAEINMKKVITRSPSMVIQ